MLSPFKSLGNKLQDCQTQSILHRQLVSNFLDRGRWCLLPRWRHRAPFFCLHRRRRRSAETGLELSLKICQRTRQVEKKTKLSFMGRADVWQSSFPCVNQDKFTSAVDSSDQLKAVMPCKKYQRTWQVKIGNHDFLGGQTDDWHSSYITHDQCKID